MSRLNRRLNTPKPLPAADVTDREQLRSESSLLDVVAAELARREES